jgi:glycerophosphoryl diester phosphodiesterase
MMVPDWLTARPFAHRGLHDEANGIIENSFSAFEAAIAAGYGIEADVQCAADGMPMVFHDHVLDRLTLESGPVADFTPEALKNVRFRGTDDKMLDLAEFVEIIDNRTPLLIEIKTRKETRPEFAARIAQILSSYKGAFALMSFDPRMIGVLHEQFPEILRGLTSGRFPPQYWPEISAFARFKLRHLFYALAVKPHFIAHDVDGLTALAPRLFRGLRGPVLSWTVRSKQNLAEARRHADNIIFEKLRP